MHINFPGSFLKYPPAWNNFALRQNWGVFVWQKGWQEENLGLGSRHKSCVQREADTATIPVKRHYSFDISFFILNNLISNLIYQLDILFVCRKHPLRVGVQQEGCGTQTKFCKPSQVAVTIMIKIIIFVTRHLFLNHLKCLSQ